MEKIIKSIFTLLLFGIIISLLNLNVYAEIEKNFLSSPKYEIRENKVLRVLANTRLDDLKKNLSVDKADRLYISNGINSGSSSYVKTGATAYVNTTEYIIYVRGDINCDGKNTVTDLSRLKLYMTGLNTNVEYKDAMDINYDGKITTLDISLLKMLLVKLPITESFVTSVEGDIAISKSTGEFTESLDITVIWPANTTGLIKRISVDSGETVLNYYKPVKMEENASVIASLINYNGETIKSTRLDVTNIDTKAPESFEFSYIHKINNQITMSGATTDDVSGIKGYMYSINEGTTWENTNIYNDVPENTIIYMKMKALDKLEHATETTVLRQNTFYNAINILKTRINNADFDIENNTITLMDGKTFKILKNNKGSYDITYLGVDDLENSKHIIEKLKLEIELGIKSQIVLWLVNAGETTWDKVDKTAGTYIDKNNQNKQIVINFEEGTYKIEDYVLPEIDFDYTLTPEFPILTNKVILTMFSTSEKDFDKLTIKYGEEIVSEYQYGESIKNITEYVALSKNGKYTITLSTKDNISISKEIYIANISDILPITETIIPNTSRNTDKTETQNGIETGPISVNATFEEVDFYNQGRYQYQIGWGVGEWINTSKQLVINDIKQNCFIFTRYFDGNKTHKMNIITIQNVDNESPEEFEFKAQKTSNSLKIIGSTLDKGSYGEASEHIGILGYKFRINDGEWTTIQPNGEYVFNNLTQNTGYKIDAVAIDKAGNEISASNSGNIVKTTIVPTITNGITYTLTPNVMTNQDVKVDFIVNSVYTILYKQDDETDWTESNTVTVQKNKSIYVRAKDSTDQFGEIGTINILNIDKLEPKSSNLQLLTYTPDNNYKFQVSALDAEATTEYSNSGIAKYEIYEQTNLLNTLNSDKESDSMYLEGNLLSNGMSIFVRAYDLAGNYKDSLPITLTLMEEADLKTSVNVGDYIAYDAGIWSQEEITAIGANNSRLSLPTQAEQFGGYKVGDSRNGNAIPWQAIYPANVEGWRVWDKDGVSIQIISGGCPEDYYHAQGRTYASEMVLTGSASNTTNAEPRDFTMYINTFLAANVKCLTKNMVDVWYNKNIDETVTDTWGVNLKTIEQNSKMNILLNGAGYWLATGRDAHLYYMDPELNKLMILNNAPMGIRLIIDMKKDLKTIGYMTQTDSNGDVLRFWIAK